MDFVENLRNLKKNFFYCISFAEILACGPQGDKMESKRIAGSVSPRQNSEKKLLPGEDIAGPQVPGATMPIPQAVTNGGPPSARQVLGIDGPNLRNTGKVPVSSQPAAGFNPFDPNGQSLFILPRSQGVASDASSNPSSPASQAIVQVPRKLADENQAGKQLQGGKNDPTSPNTPQADQQITSHAELQPVSNRPNVSEFSGVQGLA
ncbi:MAG: hypothetical protein LBC42_03570 [Puniceicoccales bacterium]|jgi:hypothetical protein|nr:hypothetical protein [Puniceicoccales bacterium]